MDALKNKPLVKETIIPHNLPLYTILNNINSEMELRISDHNVNDFEEFRKTMHSKIRNNFSDSQNMNYI
jgi:hypothetical protein